MRKMILLAVMAALAAMMLVATPALAQDLSQERRGGSGKVTICHNTGSATNPTVTIRVSVNAIPAHRMHGDLIGQACPGDKDHDKDRDRDRDHDFFDNFGDVSFEIGDVENESGDVELENNFEISGNNNNACLGQQQFGNTGNFTNQQGVLQAGGGVFVDDDNNNDRDHDWNWWNRGDRGHNWNWWHHDDDNDWWDDDDDRDRVFFGGADADDIEFSGPEVTFAPSNETSCDQSVEQAAAASSSWGW